MVPEAEITVRLMYNELFIFGSKYNYVGSGPTDENYDVGKTELALNASFIQEWAYQMQLPQNRFNVISMIGSSTYRLGKRLDFILVKFKLLSVSTSTKEAMETHAARIKSLVTTRGSEIHTRSMVNRKLDFGYILVDFGLAAATQPYVWVMPGSGVPSVTSSCLIRHTSRVAALRS